MDASKKKEKPDDPPATPKLGSLKGIVPPAPETFFDPLSEEELKMWEGGESRD